MSHACRRGCDLKGNLIGEHMYEPPVYDYEYDLEQVINLSEIGCIRRCLVYDENRNRHENRGILFTMLCGKEIQVDYCSEKDAYHEYDCLKLIIAHL
jgi:hypothetical protein